MSAAHHLSGQQLAMFMPAGELADPEKTDHGDIVRFSWPHDEIKGAKLSESAEPGTEVDTRVGRGKTPTGPSLRESIAQHGVREPVELFSPGSSYGNEKQWLTEGHHRVFTAADLNPKAEIPVRWNR